MSSRLDYQKSLVKFVQDNPGCIVDDVVAALNKRYDSLHRCFQRLEEKGYVSFKRDGKFIRYYRTDKSIESLVYEYRSNTNRPRIVASYRANSKDEKSFDLNALLMIMPYWIRTSLYYTPWKDPNYAPAY